MQLVLNTVALSKFTRTHEREFEQVLFQAKLRQEDCVVDNNIA